MKHTLPPELLYPHLVHEYYVTRVRAVSAARRQRLQALRTRADAESYVREVRRKILAMFAPAPSRGPLNLRSTGVLERGAYRVEKFLFDSRPGYVVTANCYVPAGAPPEGGFPCVLVICGHSENGKAYTEYQGLAQALARQGFVALITDPVGQGERLQCEHGHDTPITNSCDEHNMQGKQLALAGEFFGTWRAWDDQRALDILLARPDIDRDRVGVTGVSGGGTLTTYVHALDSRPTMTATACFLTTYRHNLENELPCDSEQIPPGILAAGLDQADFIIARAPRPVLLLTQRQDFFDPRGLDEAHDEIQRVYELLGAGGCVELFMGEHRHGYYQDTREAMYQFFGKHAAVAVTGREPRLTLELDAALWAAPQGQVRRVRGNRLLYQHAAAAAQAVVAPRRPPSRPALVRKVAALLELPPRTGTPHYRVLRSTGDNDCTHYYSTFWAFAVETEPGIQAIFQVWDPQNPMTASQTRLAFPMVEAMDLYLPHLSSRADVLGDEVPARPPLLYSLDVRGMGKTQALTCKSYDFLDGYGHDYMYASHGLMLNESYLGRRVHDVLSTLDLLQAQGTRRVHLIGRGLGALLATYAGLLHPLVKQVTLKNPLLSYEELTQVPLADWPLSFLPWGVLKSFDLPDCYRALQAKGLRLLQPWDARFRPWRADTLRAHLKALGLPARLVRRG
ncbi:MAG: alpha/beta hydrolase family protein [Lentisphaerae bacterium]|nr:alpha/beta hydrolase family protein [Lentisphaerota bacterium]